MNKETKDVNKNTQKATPKKASQAYGQSYSYYSNVLKAPFDSLDELERAEAEYYEKLKVKEDKAAQKKADAALVEEAFKGLNTARRVYKETLVKITEQYSQNLKNLKEAFEADKKELNDILAQAEEAYSVALKAFTEKYPEGYHLTLKDGDFETTISGSSKVNKESGISRPFDFFDWFFSL